MSEEVIQEVRRIRHEISEQGDHDIHKVASVYRRFQEELKRSGRFRISQLKRAQRAPLEKGIVEESAAR